MIEAYRRFIVVMVHAIFVFMLLEGVLRKWLLPSIEQPLLFIRDPFMLAAIAAYLIYRQGRLPPLAMHYALLVLTLLALSIFQVLNGTPIASLLVGFRFYLLFVPLLFIIPDTFRHDDITALLRLCLVASIPIGLLVIAQFYSPVGAAINKGLTDDAEGRFQVVQGVVRPYGPFTFTLGQATYAALALATLLIALTAARPPLGRVTLCLAASLILAMGALTGARSFFVSAGMIAGCMAFASMVVGARTGRFGGAFAVLLAGTAFAGLFVFVFPQAFETMLERQINAQSTEGPIYARMWSIVASVAGAMGNAPPFGYGIGAGTNAAAFLATGQRAFLLAEYEWSRTVLELGAAFGLVVIFLRVAVCVVLLRAALRALRAYNLAPMILFGFCAPLIAVAQITGNNLLVTMPWLASGLLLAIARQTQPRSQPAFRVTMAGALP